MNKNCELRLTMSPPLMGFTEHTAYTLKSIPNNPFFFSLEAADGPSFILTKPEFFFTDYQLQGNLECPENKEIDGKTVDVYVIVTIPNKSSEMTANLLAPLLVNTKTGRVCQHVMYDSTYTTRHYLFPKENFPRETFRRKLPSESYPSEKRRHCG